MPIDLFLGSDLHTKLRKREHLPDGFPYDFSIENRAGMAELKLGWCEDDRKDDR